MILTYYRVYELTESRLNILYSSTANTGSTGHYIYNSTVVSQSLQRCFLHQTQCMNDHKYTFTILLILNLMGLTRNLDPKINWVFINVIINVNASREIVVPGTYI